MTAPDPSILLVWHPMEVARCQELDEQDGWWIAGTVKATRPGERAIVYRTQRDQGIAGVFDFATRAFPHADLGWAAFGRPLLLGQEVTRQRLLASPVAEIFRRIQGRRRLPHSVRKQVAELVGEAPPWQKVDDDLPDLEHEDWTWLPARGDSGWVVEDAMRNAIRSHRRSWRKLGFRSAPQREVRPPGSHLRMDLFGPGVVAECKLVGGRSTLTQLDGYLAVQRRSSSGESWKGHVIVAHGYSDALARSVFEREGVHLWVCRRARNGKPKLIEITKERRMP